MRSGLGVRKGQAAAGEEGLWETGTSRWGPERGVSTQAGASGGALRSAQRGQSVVGAGANSDSGSGRVLWGCRLGPGIGSESREPEPGGSSCAKRFAKASHPSRAPGARPLRHQRAPLLDFRARAWMPAGLP